MSNDLVPQVEVVQNGQIMPNARVDPAVAQFIMSAAMAAQLVKMRKLQESQVPVTVKPRKYTVTDSVQEIMLSPPWISFSLVNATTAPISVWINDESDPLQEGMVLGGELFSIDMKFPVIHSLYLKAESGGTSIVRVYGKEGKEG